MKKTRKQTALAKCVLATIMAMGMMGYTTVWADTPTPSPVDKDVSKDAAGQIYDASHNYHQGYFWTDLGHAQVQIGSGEQIELFTPLFIILIMRYGIRRTDVMILCIRATIPK